jgi:hypothetical protein
MPGRERAHYLQVQPALHARAQMLVWEHMLLWPPLIGYLHPHHELLAPHLLRKESDLTRPRETGGDWWSMSLPAFPWDVPRGPFALMFHSDLGPDLLFGGPSLIWVTNPYAIARHVCPSSLTRGVLPHSKQHTATLRSFPSGNQPVVIDSHTALHVLSLLGILPVTAAVAFKPIPGFLPA